MLVALSGSLCTRSTSLSPFKRKIRIVRALHQQTSPDPPAAWNHNEDFFRFTAGRFLWNEREKLARRYVKFDVDQLARIAANASGDGSQPRKCVNVEKLKDGMNSKIFLLTMDNGAEVVAKIPYPSAGRPYYTTASEVATMSFMRDIGTPVPKVLAYDARSANNVGAEYIIMEKQNGIRLSDAWWKMREGAYFRRTYRWKVTKSLQKLVRSWAQVAFPVFGGIYFKEQIDKPSTGLYYSDKFSEMVRDDERYVFGPSSSRLNNENGRMDIEFDRGPWNSPLEYESAAGRREIACLEQIPSLLPPENPDAVHTPETYIPTRERKIKAAQCYLKLLDHILPPGTPLSARIWHDNLTLDNIFVYPKNELDICGILDWRFTEIAPFYSHTLEPNYFDTDGPSHQEAKRVGVTLNTTQMKAENERTKEYLKASLRNWAEEKNKRMLSVLGFQDSSKYDIMRLARNVLVEDEAILFHELLQFSKTAMDAGVPSSVFEEDPFNFTEPACRRIQEDMSRAMEGHNLMRKYKEKVGPKFFKNHGLASHVQFGKIQKDLQGQKKDFFRSLPHLRKSLKRTWPFGR